VKALGRHLIVEFFECTRELLNDLKSIERLCIKAVELSGASVIKPFFYQFSPFGITGVVIIAESHLSLHTWPEFGYCAFDFFVCGDDIDSEKALDFLKFELKAQNSTCLEIKRGVLGLPAEVLKHKVET
jgi:S-adenosylmethionine decarboxylase